MVISDFLLVGRENYITTETLMKLTGISSSRGIRKAISRERKAGVVILSDSNGYFLPASCEEVQRFVDLNDKKARSLEYVLKSAREYLRDNSDQVSLDGFEQNEYMKGGSG